MTTELKDAPQRTQTELDSKRLSEEVQMLGEDQSSDFAFADRMLRLIVAENRQPNFTESTYFRGKLNWDPPKVNHELRRMANVMRLQAIAGKKADRAALEAELQTSSEILEREGPRLEKEIAKLTRQKEQLERAASNAQRRNGEVQDALDKLRKPELLRSDVLETFNERLQLFGRDVGSKINSLRIEISHRELCLNRPDDLSEQQWLDSIRALDADCVRRDESSGVIRWQLNVETWAVAQSRIQSEIESMRNEIAALESQQAKFDEEQRMVSELYIQENE